MASIIHFNEITTVLNSITNYGIGKEMSSPSNVSRDNRFRPLLESVRNDLYHFDEEKRKRIIFNITDYLYQSPQEDPELISVLQRVLQLVQEYKHSQTILISPEKPRAINQHHPKEGSPVIRKLFDTVDSVLKN